MARPSWFRTTANTVAGLSVRLDPPRDDLQTGAVCRTATFDESSVDANDHLLRRLIEFAVLGMLRRISSSMRSPTAMTRLRVLVWVVPAIGGRSIRSRAAALRYEI
ncbi:MAG: hypothetical protein WB586_00090 [Chthoniobacterales bacterium]